MGSMSRKKAKALIGLSGSVEQADEAVKEYLGDDKSTKEKIAFLHGMFDVEIVGHPEVADDMTYYSMLSAIINSKYY